ncbi:MAG: hypothetical protein HQ464_03335 [Planctomycetes bacterium]|nr:hypothetical protein [Planctomycetota bacterium]
MGDAIEDLHRLVGNELLEPPVPIPQVLQPLGFLALHPAVLGPRALERRLASLQDLKHPRQILARVEHRIGVSQLGNNLLWTVLFP